MYERRNVISQLQTKLINIVVNDYYKLRHTSIIIGAKSKPSGSYYENYKKFHIIDLNCNGSEDSVFNCSHNLIEEHNCQYYDDAAIQCNGR